MGKCSGWIMGAWKTVSNGIPRAAERELIYQFDWLCKLRVYLHWGCRSSPSKPYLNKGGSQSDMPVGYRRSWHRPPLWIGITSSWWKTLQNASWIIVLWGRKTSITMDCERQNSCGSEDYRFWHQRWDWPWPKFLLPKGTTRKKWKEKQNKARKIQSHPKLDFQEEDLWSHYKKTTVRGRSFTLQSCNNLLHMLNVLAVVNFETLQRLWVAGAASAHIPYGSGHGTQYPSAHK